MDPVEVKQAQAQVGKFIGASEGLHILARMIARRLMEKTCVNGQYPHPGLPSGGDDKKNTLQSSGTADRKQTALPFSRRRPDIANALTKDEGSNGY